MLQSPIATGALTVSAADLVPTVQWAMTGFHGLPPENLAGLIAGGIVLLGHAIYNRYFKSDGDAAQPSAAAPVAAPAAPAAPAVAPAQ
jgi:hypothetical protein